MSSSSDADSPESGGSALSKAKRKQLKMKQKKQQRQLLAEKGGAGESDQAIGLLDEQMDDLAPGPASGSNSGRNSLAGTPPTEMHLRDADLASSSFVSSSASSSPSSTLSNPLASPTGADFAQLSGGDSPVNATTRTIDSAGSPRRPPPTRMGAPEPIDVHERLLRAGLISDGVHSSLAIWKARGRDLLSWTTWKYYLSHAYREALKRKCNFALGFFSCWLVVMVAAVCYTLIARAPVVFLQQAETAAGQIDLELTPADAMQSPFLNFTTLRTNVGANPQYALSTARLGLQAYVLPAKACSGGAQGWDTSSATSLDWVYVGFNNASSPTCTNTSTACLESLCTFSDTARTTIVPLNAIDTLREKRMGLGRTWPLSEPLAEDACVITSDLARLWSIGVGDRVMVKMTGPTFPRLVRDLIATGVTWDGRDHPFAPHQLDANVTLVLDEVLRVYTPVVYLPFTVARVVTKTYGKFTTDADPMVIVESGSLLAYALRHLHPILRETRSIADLAAALGEEATWQAAAGATTSTIPMALASYPLAYPESLLNSDSYATAAQFNLPGDSRTSVYLSTDFDTIQATLIGWSSAIIYLGGFTQVASSLPVLGEMDAVKMFSLYLGLILSILLTILFLLSTLLIYSLLMISIETRTFELGVHRMCGMSRFNIVKLLVVQALSFSVPAWALGLVISQIMVAVIVGRLEASVEVPLSKLLTGEGIRVASLMGLVLPLVASILPIRSALGRNLQDALDTRHSKTAGVEFSIERTVDSGLDGAWMALGIGMAVLGGSIYYLVPLALLNGNLALFFDIFFGLLLGMLLGLILLSLNFQPLLERLIVFLTLWWEGRATSFIVVKNLVTHRVRNRKTAIMFALSLGFILFITMAFQLEIYSAKARTYKNFGADMVVYPRYTGNLLTPEHVRELESLLTTAVRPGTIADYGWVTPRLGWHGEWDDTVQSNLGHAFSGDMEIWGASSNLFELTFNQYLVRDDATPKETDSPLSEQLYTVAGSQASIQGTSAKAQFGLSSTNGQLDSFLYVLQRRASDTTPQAALEFHRFRALTFLDNSPRFYLGRFPTKNARPTVVSIPTFMRLSGGMYQRAQDVPMAYCLIKFADGTDVDGGARALSHEKDALYAALQDFTKQHSLQVWDIRQVEGQLDKSNRVMTMIFSIATYLAMFLCLFSLVASMLSNIYEQSHEISVLRSIGLREWAVLRIYTYEAFVLVMSSSLLGILIGFAMGGTLIAQRVLLTQLEIPFNPPLAILAYVFTGSIVCAFIASWVPARQLMKGSIARIMKSVL